MLGQETFRLRALRLTEPIYRRCRRKFADALEERVIHEPLQRLSCVRDAALHEVIKKAPARDSLEGVDRSRILEVVPKNLGDAIRTVPRMTALHGVMLRRDEQGRGRLDGSIQKAAPQRFAQGARRLRKNAAGRRDPAMTGRDAENWLIESSEQAGRNDPGCGSTVSQANQRSDRCCTSSRAARTRACPSSLRARNA